MQHHGGAQAHSRARQAGALCSTPSSRTRRSRAGCASAPSCCRARARGSASSRPSSASSWSAERGNAHVQFQWRRGPDITASPIPMRICNMLVGAVSSWCSELWAHRGWYTAGNRPEAAGSAAPRRARERARTGSCRQQMPDCASCTAGTYMCCVCQRRDIGAGGCRARDNGHGKCKRGW